MTDVAEARESHVYVYGVARCGSSAPLSAADNDGVVPGAPVELLPVDGLTAIVSIFPAELAMRDPAVSEDDWAKSRALAHHRVLAAFAGCTALAPSKFGTVLRSLDDLTGFVRRNASALDLTLNSIAECREWGLKLFGDLSAARGSVELSPALASMQEELASAPAGKAFFLRKKFQAAAEAELQRVLMDRIAAIHDELAGIARDSTQIGRLVAASPGKPALFLNAAYLVEKSKEDEFHEALTAMRGTYSEIGLSDSLTGPWPAYNFVSLPAVMANHG